MIKIVTLGNFLIKINGRIVSENTGRSKKLWQLLNLFILNRNKPLPLQTMIDYICFDEDIEFASKAIHNLIYRLKHIFSESGGSSKFIIFTNNGYMLNTNEELAVDVYILEDNYEKAKIPGLPEKEKIECFEKIIELYNGEYLSNQFGDKWTMNAAARYSRIFENSVVVLSGLYLGKAEYEKLFQICDKALMLEPFEEAIYICMIKGLMQTEQNVRAIALCEKYFGMLSAEMGINATETMQKLYAEIKGGHNHSIAEKQILLEDFKNDKIANKLFFCDLKTFNNIYRHELRQIERRKKDVILSIISINKKDGGIPSKNTLYEARRQLRESCLRTLRKGDVSAEYSENQDVILLTNIKYENHKIVAERIKNYFYKNFAIKDVYLNFQIISSIALEIDSDSDIAKQVDNFSK